MMVIGRPVSSKKESDGLWTDCSDCSDMSQVESKRYMVDSLIAFTSLCSGRTTYLSTELKLINTILARKPTSNHYDPCPQAIL